MLCAWSIVTYLVHSVPVPPQVFDVTPFTVQTVQTPFLAGGSRVCFCAETSADLVSQNANAAADKQSVKAATLKNVFIKNTIFLDLKK
jgi:hypothetical protein